MEWIPPTFGTGLCSDRFSSRATFGSSVETCVSAESRVGVAVDDDVAETGGSDSFFELEDLLPDFLFELDFRALFFAEFFSDKRNKFFTAFSTVAWTAADGFLLEPLVGVFVDISVPNARRARPVERVDDMLGKRLRAGKSQTAGKT